MKHKMWVELKFSLKAVKSRNETSETLKSDEEEKPEGVV